MGEHLLPVGLPKPSGPVPSGPDGFPGLSQLARYGYSAEPPATPWRHDYGTTAFSPSWRSASPPGLPASPDPRKFIAAPRTS